MLVFIILYSYKLASTFGGVTAHASSASPSESVTVTEKTLKRIKQKVFSQALSSSTLSS